MPNLFLTTSDEYLDGDLKQFVGMGGYGNDVTSFYRKILEQNLGFVRLKLKDKLQNEF